MSFYLNINDSGKENIWNGSKSAPVSPRKKQKTSNAIVHTQTTFLTLSNELIKHILDFLPLNDQLKPVCRQWRVIFDSGLLAPKISFLMEADASFENWQQTFPNVVSKLLKADRVFKLTLWRFEEVFNNGHPCGDWLDDHLPIIQNSNKLRQLVINDSYPSKGLVKAIGMNRSISALKLELFDEPKNWKSLFKNNHQIKDLEVEISDEENPFELNADRSVRGRLPISLTERAANYDLLSRWMTKVIKEGQALQSFTFSISFDDASEAVDFQERLESIIDKVFNDSSLKKFNALICYYDDLVDDEDAGLITIERKKG